MRRALGQFHDGWNRALIINEGGRLHLLPLPNEDRERNRYAGVDTRFAEVRQ
jgi:hypothetical protein